jgi:alcohol dehydrogenase class IV
MSHPVGARYGVHHGMANAIFLPWVIEYNAAGNEELGDRYREICHLLGVDAAGDAADVGAALGAHVRELTARLGLPTRLSEVGVPEEGIAQLAADAMGEGPTLVNPREPSEEEFAALFTKAM